MASTILLDITTNDLTIDDSGNIARADEPYSLAQDAASAIKTFLGEVYFDVTIGVAYQNILGKTPSLSSLKSQLIAAAETVPDVASAQVFISAFTDRTVAGQVHVTSETTGQTAAASFAVTNPQTGA